MEVTQEVITLVGVVGLNLGVALPIRTAAAILQTQMGVAIIMAKAAEVGLMVRRLMERTLKQTKYSLCRMKLRLMMMEYSEEIKSISEGSNTFHSLICL